MAASAGTVTLELDANSIKLIRGLQKAQRQSKTTATKMRRNMGDAFKSIARAAAVSAAAMAAAGRMSIKYADNIGKTSAAVGLTAEKYQELSFAAQRAGIASSQFGSNLTAFVKRVGEAKAGTGPLVSGLKKLNPTLLENLKNTRNQAEAFDLIADAISKSNSATEQAAIANAAFSRAGVGMVNMMRDGADGLDSMAQKARDLGVVLSDNAVKKAEEATDKLGDLQQVMKVSIAATTLENADSIVSLANALIGFVSIIGKATNGWNLWLAAQGIGVKSIDEIRARGQQLLTEKRKLEKELKGNEELDTSTIWGKASALPDWVVRQKEERIAAIKEEQMALQDMAVALQKLQRPDSRPEPIDLGLDPADTEEKANSIVTTLADMMRQIKTFGMTDDERALINFIDAGANEEQIAQFRHAQEELRILTEKERIANAELEEVVVTAKRYKKEIEEGANAMDQFAIQAARNLQTALADFLFDPFEDGLKGMLKGFGNMIRQMVAEVMARQILMALFGGLSGSSNGFLASFGSALSGKRASGGPVSAHGAYLVGERGAEVLQMGSASGHIIPNHELGQGGSVTVNIDARETDNPARLLSLVPVITQQVEQGIALKQRRGYL